MIWIPLLVLAALTFLIVAFVLKLPRSGWTLFGSALLFGLTGYALQGSPGQSSAPKQAVEIGAQTGELLINARRKFFQSDGQPSRLITTADGFARRGNFEDASKSLQNAIEENPRDGEAWVALGNALIEHAGGQPTPPALFAFTQAEKVMPGNAAPAYFAGLAFLRSRQPGRARRIWADSLEGIPPGAPGRETLEIQLAELEAFLMQGPVRLPTPSSRPSELDDE
jgi:Cytochrome c biogenesis factor